MSTQLVSDLNIKVHQLSLLQQVVDLPGLQPAERLLLPEAEVDEKTQTGLSAFKSRSVRPENNQKDPVAPNFQLKLII